ncbi:MAG: hypothetical protein HUU50_07685 [Candidatus Brocadiae bacterium]|nr:hypothetical protein [Candidatus Brocadiia bacterium]
MEEKKTKRKFRWKTWLFLLFLAMVAYIIYFTPGLGGSLGSFLLIFEKEQPKLEEQKNQGVSIYMRFVDDILEIDGIAFPKEYNLEEKIRILQKKYFPTEVTVTYLEKPSDPYILAKKAEKILKENNFGFKIKKNENYGKEK